MKGSVFAFRFLFNRRCALAALVERAGFPIPFVAVGFVAAVGATVGVVAAIGPSVRVVTVVGASVGVAIAVGATEGVVTAVGVTEGVLVAACTTSRDIRVDGR